MACAWGIIRVQPMRRNLSGRWWRRPTRQLRRVTKYDFGHVLAEDPTSTEALLRQLARRVKATNERVAGRG
jgi:hypothetical protein